MLSPWITQRLTITFLELINSSLKQPYKAASALEAVFIFRFSEGYKVFLGQVRTARNSPLRAESGTINRSSTDNTTRGILTKKPPKIGAVSLF